MSSLLVNAVNEETRHVDKPVNESHGDDVNDYITEQRNYYSL